MADYGRKDILELIAKSGGRTRIDKSKLPWSERRLSRLKDYLKDLCELDNIKDEGDDIYSLTEKGNDYFKRAIEAKPDFPIPYYWMAYYRCRNREDKEAITLFEKYLEVAKGDPDEVDRVRVAKKVLKELYSGIEGKNLSMMRRPLRKKK